MSSTRVAEPDPYDARRVCGAAGLLAQFNDAGVLSAADVHVAARLALLAGERDESVMLAAALATRGPRVGHVHVDLASIRDTAVVDLEERADLSTLGWPEHAEWIGRVAVSALVAAGEEGDDVSPRPFRLVGSSLYLDRYWGEERLVADELRRMGEGVAAGVEDAVLAEGLARLFAGQTDGRQCLAAAAAVLRPFAVVAGGPGTGKTTTVARIVALLAEQAIAAGSQPPLMALAAPTGKAAARLEQAVHEESAGLLVDERVRELLMSLHASTLHRLLGWRPDSGSRFRHGRSNHLPHDVVIVDETSMVSLSMMARLIEAVRPDARLVLVGDPGQLASIEAGAVLGDVVGPAADRLVMRPPARARLERVTGHRVSAQDPPAGVGIGDGIVVLDRVHRFGGGIAALAAAVRRGDGDAVIEVLSAPREDLAWLAVDAGEPGAEPALTMVRDAVVGAALRTIEAARAGRAGEAIDALAAVRVLCAHRRGAHGVARWTTTVEGWLEAELGGFFTADRWYLGRPLLVTENDYELGLYNGDTGVIVRTSGGDAAVAAFERRGEIAEYSPMRLGPIESAYAMTIHKSQGSQFDTAVALLPDPASRVLSRELLYTAVTRARRRLIVAAAEATIRAAVARPIARASGLRRRLWAAGG